MLDPFATVGASSGEKEREKESGKLSASGRKGKKRKGKRKFDVQDLVCLISRNQPETFFFFITLKPRVE